MTASKRSRFSLSGNTENVVQRLIPKDELAAGKVPMQEPKINPTSDAKEMNLLDTIQARLIPERFYPQVVPQVLEPFKGSQENFPIAAGILQDAVRRSEKGGEVTLTASQLAFLANSYSAISEALVELIATACTLEWTLAMTSLCLAHLKANPCAEEAAKTNATYVHMMDLMVKHTTGGKNV